MKTEPQIVTYILEGLRAQNGRWDKISTPFTFECDARTEESEYRAFMEGETRKGWLDFRVVRETLTREVLP